MDDKRKIKFLGLSLIGGLVLSVVVTFYTWQYHKERLIWQTQQASVQDPVDTFSDALPSSGDPTDTVSEMREKMQAMMKERPHDTNSLSVQDIHYDMQETADKYLITIDIPEGKNIDLETQLLGDQFIMSAKVTSVPLDQSKGVSGSTSGSSQIQQSIHLASAVDALAMKIEQDDQRISIMIPKQ